MANKIVQCANCGRKNQDYGRSATCDFCGCSPLPSYSYEKGSGFYPPPKRKSITLQVGRKKVRI